MSQSRSITDFFKTPASSSRSDNQASPHIPPARSQPESSPGHGAWSGKDGVEKSLQDSMLVSQGGSVSSSQRVIKNGKVVVTSSDGDDTDSLSSLDDPDDLLRMFTSSSRPTTKDCEKEHIVSPARPLNQSPKPKTTGTKKPSSSKAPPSYKFSLQSLVTDAVDDNEVESSIAKIKKALESSENAANGTPGGGNKGQKGEIRQEMLASAIGLEEGDTSLQRMMDAVNRTDAFSHDLSWSFFEDQAAHHQTLSPEPFPVHVVSDDPAVTFLKDPVSRERLVYSAFLNSSFSSNSLPDEIVLWILNIIPCEPREHIRYAYCRAFDFAPQEWISSKLRPTHIEKLFLNLGARPVALNLSESLEPTNPSPDEYSLRDWRCLVSVLGLLERLAKKFSNDTREHALNILFRLTLDDSLVRDSGVCLGVENAIAALCREATNQSTNASILRVTRNILETIQQPEFRARLLKHINPVTPSVSLVRCRLALSFFLEDPSLLDVAVDKVFDLNRISTRLTDKRFDFSRRQKAQRGKEFEYGELAAFTTFLDIGICSGTPSLASSSSSSSSPPSSSASRNKLETRKVEEARFNGDVDTLANRLKAVFSSIEDSGASHLKRTETKETLEALYYRILYTVRTEPQPKRSLIVPGKTDEWNGIRKSGALMDRFLTSKPSRNGQSSDENRQGEENVKVEEDIPIRQHTTE